jgi:hypothetical protein
MKVRFHPRTLITTGAAIARGVAAGRAEIKNSRASVECVSYRISGAREESIGGRITVVRLEKPDAVGRSKHPPRCNQGRCALGIPWYREEAYLRTIIRGVRHKVLPVSQANMRCDGEGGSRGLANLGWVVATKARKSHDGDARTDVDSQSTSSFFGSSGGNNDSLCSPIMARPDRQAFCWQGAYVRNVRGAVDVALDDAGQVETLFLALRTHAPASEEAGNC